ncbi:cytochrome P450 [Roseovarius aestuarii]|nr:cytochrome P450 [Roseovarius aestuarii]
MNDQGSQPQSAAMVANRQKTAPGPRGAQMIPLAARLTRDAAETLRQLTVTYGDVVQFNFFGRFNTIIARPEHVHQVLKDQAAHFVKGDIYKEYGPLIGLGLLSSDGPVWAKSRKIITPAFRTTHNGAFLRIMAEVTDEYLNGWSERMQNGPVQLDMAQEMNALTFRIIARALFSVDLGERSAALFDALERGNRAGTARIRSAVKFPYHWPTPANKRYRAAVAELDAIIEPLINARLAATTPPDDFFTALTQALARGDIDRKTVRDQAITFFFAGHETTSNALSWSFHLLSEHHAIQQRARDEARQAGSPTMDSLAASKQIEAVLSEAMRLYPPIYAMQRKATQDTEIAGFHVPKGSGVAIMPYITHRHSEFWPDPTRFNPDRFVNRVETAQNRYAYFPFGAGPRICIGRNFALLEGLVVLTLALARFRFDAVPGHRVKAENLISMAPKGGLPMRVESV